MRERQRCPPPHPQLLQPHATCPHITELAASKLGMILKKKKKI